MVIQSITYLICNVKSGLVNIPLLINLLLPCFFGMIKQVARWPPWINKPFGREWLITPRVLKSIFFYPKFFTKIISLDPMSPRMSQHGCRRSSHARMHRRLDLINQPAVLKCEILAIKCHHCHPMLQCEILAIKSLSGSDAENEPKWLQIINLQRWNSFFCIHNYLFPILFSGWWGLLIHRY